jgi:hypothetical protein
MKISIVVLAAALGSVALPAMAASPQDQDQLKLTYNAKTGKYCASAEVTGSRLPVQDCRTKEEWMKAGAKISDASPEKVAPRLAQK